MAGGRLKILDLPIFNLFRSLRSTPRKELMARFAVRYDNFKLLLESNTELLKIIADIEEKLRGKSAFGQSYIEAQTLRTFFHCGRMIECIEKMSGRPYPHLRRTLERIQNAVKGEAADRPSSGQPRPTEFVLRYAEIPSRELSVFVGEKNANLAEVRNRVGLAVPRGFAVTTAAFEHFMAANRLEEVVRRLKAKVDIIETETILQVSEQIQMLIAEAEVPPSLGRVILEAFDELEASVPPARRPLCVSLRSSAIGEDATLSFAGQYLTVLNVPRERVLEEYKNILASLFSPRAIAYRLHMGIPFHEASMAVACLEMVPARASGVLYTRNPVNPFDNRILIQAVRGLGPYAVDGIVPPDAYVFEKTTPPRLAEKRIAEQSVRLVGLPGGAVAEEEIPEAERGLPCLSDAQAAELAAAGLRLEEHFQGPQDVEWALDEAGGIVILQARPLRIEGCEPGEDCPLPPAPPHAKTLLEGAEIACVGVGCGVAVHVHSEKDLASFPDGGVLVAVHPSPQYVIAMNKAQAIVTDYGGVVCHMASLAREYLVPTLLNARQATAVIPEGAEVTVDAYHGRVYLGRVAEILEAQPQRGGARVRGPAYQALRRRADLIVPLYLTDPKSPQFGEEHCRTIHDIMRFVHETAYTVIFQLGDLVTDRSRISVRLKAPVPLDLYVIDLFGGLSVDATRTSQVTPEQVVSVPFRALLRGMLHPALCSPQIRPVNLSGFVSVLSEQMLSQPGAGSERFGDRSYAIISDKYLNFSSRVGYHYSVLDSYCGKTAAKNYIHFQFKGGAADDVRRARRARMIEQVLAHYGFLVDTQGDNVRARVSKQEQPQVEELLTMLGSLLLFTRQMDMMMHTEEHVRQLTRCFLEGNFQLDPEGGGRVGCTLPPSAQEERGGGGRGG